MITAVYSILDLLKLGDINWKTGILTIEFLQSPLATSPREGEGEGGGLDWGRLIKAFTVNLGVISYYEVCSLGELNRRTEMP